MAQRLIGSPFVAGNMQVTGQLTKVGGVATDGSYGVAVVLGAASDAAQSTVSSVVASIVAPAPGNYRLGGSFRVITATTSAEIQYAWTNSAGAQTYTAAATSAYAVGTYPLPDRTVWANSGATVGVNQQNATAGQVLVSATIEALD